jgi:hypothetical protein
MIVAAVAAVSADADPRRRACLSMSGRASLNTIGHAAVVGGSGVPRLLFHWDPSQSMLQNESPGYGIIYRWRSGTLDVYKERNLRELV